MSQHKKDLSTESTQSGLEKVRQAVQAFEKLLGPARELDPEERERFEAKWRNATRLKKWPD